MTLVITKLHHTHRKWFQDLKEDHPLLRKGVDMQLLQAQFGSYAIKDYYDREPVLRDSSFTVKEARSVVCVPIDVALGLNKDVLEAISPRFETYLNSFKNQCVIALLIGVKKP